MACYKVLLAPPASAAFPFRGWCWLRNRQNCSLCHFAADLHLLLCFQVHHQVPHLCRRKPYCGLFHPINLSSVSIQRRTVISNSFIYHKRWSVTCCLGIYHHTCCCSLRCMTTRAMTSHHVGVTSTWRHMQTCWAQKPNCLIVPYQALTCACSSRARCSTDLSDECQSEFRHSAHCSPVSGCYIVHLHVLDSATYAMQHALPRLHRGADRLE